MNATTFVRCQKLFFTGIIWYVQFTILVKETGKKFLSVMSIDNQLLNTKIYNWLLISVLYHCMCTQNRQTPHQVQAQLQQPLSKYSTNSHNRLEVSFPQHTSNDLPLPSPLTHPCPGRHCSVKLLLHLLHSHTHRLASFQGHHVHNIPGQCYPIMLHRLVPPLDLLGSVVDMDLHLLTMEAS